MTKTKVIPRRFCSSRNSYCISVRNFKSSGDVLLDGKRINDIPINKRDVHTVFQSYALFPHMNVFDNVAFALKLKKVPKKEIEERVKEALKMVQLDGYQK